MKINKTSLFDLTPEQEATSKMMYDGKIIKCLVAPYHSYPDLEKIVPFTKTTYLFPERETSVPQLRNLISMIVASPSTDEFRIITTNQNIIMDMVDSSVRVLTEDGDVVDCPCKTFMANIHDIRYELLENEAHRSKDGKQNVGVDIINVIIDKINKSKGMTKSEKDSLRTKIDIIGEPLIKDRLNDMLDDVKVI